MRQKTLAALRDYSLSQPNEKRISGHKRPRRELHGRICTHVRYDCIDPHKAELIAAREGLLFAWELGFRRVYLEGDAKNVYSRLKDSMEYFS